jgi:hypothetical protein
MASNNCAGDRFLQEIDRSRLHRLDLRRHGAPQFSLRFQPGHSRHAQINHQAVMPLRTGASQKLRRRGEGLNFVSSRADKVLAATCAATHRRRQRRPGACPATAVNRGAWVYPCSPWTGSPISAPHKPLFASPILPPWASTLDLQMASPMPIPAGLLVKKGVKYPRSDRIFNTASSIRNCNRQPAARPTCQFGGQAPLTQGPVCGQLCLMGVWKGAEKRVLRQGWLADVVSTPHIKVAAKKGKLG